MKMEVIQVKIQKDQVIKKIVKEIVENKIERVIFLKIDRLSRNKEDYFNFYKLCCGFDVELRTNNNSNRRVYTRNINTISRNGKKTNIRKKKSRVCRKLQRGEYPFGGIMPLGISKDDNNKLYYNKDIEKVKFIFSELSRGNTYQGVRRLYDKKYNKNNHVNYIEEIVKRDIYKCIINYQEIEYKLIEPLDYKDYGINFIKEIEVKNTYELVFKFKNSFKLKIKYDRNVV